MTDTKSVLASRTVWANLVGFLALILGLLGYDLSALDEERLVESVAQLVAAGSFIASTAFRVAATKTLAG